MINEEYARRRIKLLQRQLKTTKDMAIEVSTRISQLEHSIKLLELKLAKLENSSTIDNSVDID